MKGRQCFVHSHISCLFQVIHSTPNKNVYKALIAADYVGVKVELVENFVFGETNKSEPFLKLNPFGKVFKSLSLTAFSQVILMQKF